MADSTKVFLTYQYRIYPNVTQERQLERILDVACHIYNDIVHTANMDYADGKRWFWVHADKFWGQQRKNNTIISKLLSFGAVSDLVRRYDRNLKSFWALRRNGREEVLPPGWIVRRDFQSVGYRAEHGFTLKLPKDNPKVARLRVYAIDGRIRVHYHRPIPVGWRIMHCVITHNSRGQWYASFLVEGYQDRVPPDRAVGIDVGMYSLLALSDGTLTDNPRWYRECQQQRRILNRQLARRQKNGPDGKPLPFPQQSQNWRDTRLAIARHEAKIARERAYWWNQITDWLTDNYGLIAIEDLNLEFMIKNRHLAMSAHDAAFGIFWEQLAYKCRLRGVELVKVNPAYTSQICSGCGEIVKKDLSVRVHRCECGLELDRDVNAAINILNLALNDWYSSRQDITRAVAPSVS